MKTTFLLIISCLILISCTNHNELDKKGLIKDVRKEVLEIVLLDMKRLNYTENIFPETNDTLVISNLTLISNSDTDIEIDTIENWFWTFTLNSIPTTHPFFDESIDYITEQIDNLISSNWDTSSLNIEIPIDYPLEELGDTVGDITGYWISTNIKDKSFLQISEPIYNVNGDIIVSVHITLDGYVIGKLYVIKDKDGSLEVWDKATIIGKFSEPEFIADKEGEAKGHIKKRTYLILLGYYDI